MLSPIVDFAVSPFVHSFANLRKCRWPRGSWGCCSTARILISISAGTAAAFPTSNSTLNVGRSAYLPHNPAGTMDRTLLHHKIHSSITSSADAEECYNKLIDISFQDGQEIEVVNMVIADRGFSNFNGLLRGTSISSSFGRRDRVCVSAVCRVV